MADLNINSILKEIKDTKNTLEDILLSYGIEVNKKKVTSVFSTEKSNLKDLKMAAIMDAFTLGNFKSECNLFELTSQNWHGEMEEFKPDVLFVESAWHGKNKSWYKKIANGSKELYELTEYCHKNNIPVVFWNKEDPVFTDVFMSAAACSDFVFTTDIDCIDKYKKNLQSDNVFLLHFAAQPLVHNPIEMHERKDKFCFAGAYYHRYKERSKIFDSFADVFIETKGFDIFDRNYGNPAPEHAFPQRYNSMILGSLPSDKIHIAYKGYNYGINMNSVNQSQSMFARRVMELLASNTITVGNYSRGQKNFFGDLTLCTDSSSHLKNHLDIYCKDEESLRKYRLLGLRKVLSQHLCEDRLGYIMSKVFSRDMKKPLPPVVLFAQSKTEKETEQIIKSFKKQDYESKELYIISSNDIPCEDENNIHFISEKDSEKMNIATFENRFAGVISPCDYYGEYYLFDLCLTSRYGDFNGFGKVDFYENQMDKISIEDKSHTYRQCSSLNVKRSIIKCEKIRLSVSDFVNSEDISCDNLFCTDEFNYCRNIIADSLEEVDDIFVADQGLSMSELESFAENIKIGEENEDMQTLSAKEMTDVCKKSNNKKVNCVYFEEKLSIESHLNDDEKQFIEFVSKMKPSEEGITDNISVMVSSIGNMYMSLSAVFYDSANKKIGEFSSEGKMYLSTQIPSRCEYISLFFEISGTGTIQVAQAKIGSDINVYENMPFVSRTDTLVLTNRYPSYEELYRNMFIHRRVVQYKKRGFNVDVMTSNYNSRNAYREYNGINVIEGQSERLVSVIENGQIKNLLVHFMNPYLWSAIKQYTDKLNVYIFSHGFDIQPWERRKYNFNTEAEIERAKKESQDRVDMWNEIFKFSENDKIHFVFVSEYLRREVEEDYNVKFTDENSSVIYNCIDTQLYDYVPKQAEQRLKVLAIKSFDNRNYANDVMQKAIIEISKEPEFSKITFDIYGSGFLFDKDTAPLKKFSNVNIYKKFLTPDEIAIQHKTHGIFLATTRMDTQGVSRDEAMSSGLVPVSNKVAGVPEFVDEKCGILAPNEDYKAVAQGILDIVRNEEMFLSMSQNSAKKVREKTACEITVPKEMNLLNR